MAERYVVLGLARTRCHWFGQLSHWSTAGVAPIEFIKCLSAEEARAVMGTGRRVSAFIVDGGLGRFDRDLVASASEAGAPTIVVEDRRNGRDWSSIGCVAALDQDFTRDQLVEVLDRHARVVDRSVHRPRARTDLTDDPAPGRMVGVTGTGGSGASTVAMALAQALAPTNGMVALVDGARRADLALYHDVGDVIPGLPELVDLQRRDSADPEEVRGLLFGIDDRGYDLLLGLRRSRDWAGLRPHAVDAALESLRRSHDLVVVDHDPDVEGEAETGSVEVEDRNAVARAVMTSADLVLLVTRPGMKGVHDLLRLFDEFTAAGTPVARLVPVVDGSPRSRPGRTELARAVRDLTAGHSSGRAEFVPPVFVPHVRGLEDAHRSAGRLPERLTRSLGQVVSDLLAALPRRATAAEVGTAIRIGDLASDAALDLRGDVA
jgi:MinD-like ATPase involved in chromosome partitioning or flagellar assembly